jgi:hypothetical protein
MLDDAQVEAFIEDGFVRIEDAFPREMADECREIIWRDLNADPGDPATWPRPVAVRPDYAQAPFEAAANTPHLHAAFDDLVGEGRWLVGCGYPFAAADQRFLPAATLVVLQNSSRWVDLGIHKIGYAAL